MIEITNRLQGPVQLIIRSRTKSRAFTCLNIPGRGSGRNVYQLEDERTTEYIERAVRDGLISTKYVNTKEGD
jgi:hypothetical protein